MFLSKYLVGNIFIYIICIIIGIIHWFLFSQFDEISWKSFDWMGSFTSFDILKQSLFQLKIPYHSTGFGSMINIPVVDISIIEKHQPYEIRFFSNGFTYISPQIILLKFVSVKSFISINLIFYFLIGMYGIYRWSEELKLSTAATFFLFIILSLNGFIVSRMGIGHLLYCNAYMFIPLYFWLLYKFVDIEYVSSMKMFRHALLFSLFIFFTKLNANGQNTYQFLFVGLVVMLFYPKRLLWYTLSIALSFILMSFYIIPTAIFSRYITSNRVIFAGYGFQSGDAGIPVFELDSAANLFQKIIFHFVNIVNHLWESLTVPFTAAHDATWEYNLYIGKFGLILILLSVAMVIFKNRKNFELKNHRYLFPALIVALLSVSVFKPLLVSVFETITQITFPKVDRLASRLMIYPFSLVLMFAAIGFDDLFAMIHVRCRSFIKWGSLLILFIILMQHSYGWSVSQTESHYVRPADEVRHLFKTVILDIEGDDFYKKAVNISYLISFLSFLGMVTGYFYLNRRIKHSSARRDLVSS